LKVSQAIEEKIEMEAEKIEVLLIEDSKFATELTKKMLDKEQSTGFNTDLNCAESLKAGLEYLTCDKIDIVLLDLTLPDSQELNTFKKVKAKVSDIPIVVMSGLEDEGIAMSAVKRGAQDYLVKGRFDSNLLKRSILYAMERNRAEKQIRKLNMELEKSLMELKEVNSELEAFSYSVSHDLRAPLRAITGFSNILLEDYTDALDAEGKRLLNVIQSNTKKMGQLIDDLLSFSRLGRKEIKKSNIGMENLAKTIFEELKFINQERTIKLNYNALPSAHGDPALIREVFANLLANAIKFTKKEENAVIEIGCETKENENIYYVKDNGVGFDMEYANKLFGVFQRLHSDKEFEGTGVGLAIVQRIIHKHGGRVWAEGKVNGGATFYFTLPIVEGAM
jgi:two-component system sensor histidine kinase/response regulator